MGSACTLYLVTYVVECPHTKTDSEGVCIVPKVYNITCHSIVFTPSESKESLRLLIDPYLTPIK